MKKLNHSALIVCIAASLLILGTAAALSFGYGIHIGLPVGVGAFFVLIIVMVIYNSKWTKKK